MGFFGAFFLIWTLTAAVIGFDIHFLMSFSAPHPRQPIEVIQKAPVPMVGGR